MKRTIIIIAAVTAMLVAGNTAKAQETPEDIMAKFFTMFNDDVNKAIDYLFSTNEWLEANKEGTTAMKEKFEASRKLLGNFKDKVWKLQNMNFHSDFEKDMVKVEN